jgi:hypothetical protein
MDPELDAFIAPFPLPTPNTELTTTLHRALAD